MTINTEYSSHFESAAAEHELKRLAKTASLTLDDLNCIPVRNSFNDDGRSYLSMDEDRNDSGHNSIISTSRSRSFSSPNALLRAPNFTATPSVANSYLAPPSVNNGPVVEVTFLPMPLQNYLFVMAELDKSGIVKAWGFETGEISRDDFRISGSQQFFFF
jgi:hypothetical protein